MKVFDNLFHPEKVEPYRPNRAQRRAQQKVMRSQQRKAQKAFDRQVNAEVNAELEALRAVQRAAATTKAQQVEALRAETEEVE